MNDNDRAAIRPTIIDRITGRHRRACDDLAREAASCAVELRAQAKHAELTERAEAAEAAAAARKAEADRARAALRSERSHQTHEARRAQLAAVSAALAPFKPGKLYRNNAFQLVGTVSDFTRRAPAVEMRRKGGRAFGAPAYLSDVTLYAREAATLPADAEFGPDPQGTIATPRLGDLFDVEMRDELKPWGMRGLGFDHGEMQRFHRGDPAVKDAVNKRTSIGIGATWEWHAPDVDPALLDRMGVDIDDVKRMAEDLNGEFALNQSLDVTNIRSQAVRGIQVCGFSNHEFGLNLQHDGRSPRIGERIAFIEPREQSSIQGWVIDKRGVAIGYTQLDPNGSSSRGSSQPVVDLRRTLHAVNQQDGANAEGIPELRAPWTYHTIAAEFLQSALLHRKRFGGGIPVLKGIDTDKVDGDTAALVRQAIGQYANHEEAYLAAMDGISIDILPPVSDGQLIDVLEFCVAQKRLALGANMFDLGSNGVGSFALASVQGEFYLKMLGGFYWPVAASYRSLTRAYCDAYYAAPDGHAIYPEMRITRFATRSPSEVLQLHSDVAALRAAGASEAQVEDAAKAVDIEYRAPGALATEAAEEAEGAPPSEEASIEQPILSGIAIDAASRIAEQLAAGTLPREFAKMQLIAAGFLPDAAQQMIDSVPAHTSVPATTATPTPEPAAETRSRAPHVCGAGCDHVSLYARRPRIPSMTRGGEFVTFRALTPREEVVNLPGLEGEMLGSEERIAEAVMSVKRDHRAAFVEAARPLWDATPPRTAELASLSVDFVGQYTDALRAEVDGLSAWVADDMRSEIRAALGLGDDEAIPSSPQTSDTAAEPSQQRDAAIDLLARKLNDRANEQFRSLSVQVSSGAPKSVLTTTGGIFSPGHTTRLMVSQVVSTAVNATRDEVASTGPRVMRATYSAVMDRWTCDECRSMDGRQFVYPSQAYERAKPPNPRCHGLLSSKGLANPCHCVMLYDFEPIVGPVTEDAEGSAAPQLRGREPMQRRAMAPAQVTLVVGPPGSGKSTHARTLDGVVLDKDAWMFAGEALSGLTSAQAWSAMLDALESIPGPVALVAPLTTRAARAKAIEDVRERGAAVCCIRGADADSAAEADARNAERPGWRRVSDAIMASSVGGYEVPEADEAPDVMLWAPADSPSSREE